MTLKLIVLTTFLFVTNYVATTETNASFNVENVWRNSGGKIEPNWIPGIQTYYNDVEIAFKAFPREVLDDANLVLTTFETYLIKIIRGSNSESEIHSTGATVVLAALSQIKVDTYDPQGIINEFVRVLPILMKAYRMAASNLRPTLGYELVSAVNNDLNDLECAFRLYMEKFNAGDINGVKKEVDYVPVTTRVQKLVDTVALRGNVTLTVSQLADPKVQDSMVVLSFVVDHVIICNHGLRSSSDAVLL